MAGWRKRRRAYLDDYKINEEGQYEYQGVRYKWPLEEMERKKLQRRLQVMEILAIAAALLAGCIPAPGVGSSACLILPYAFGVVAVISLGLALWPVCTEPDPMRGHVYEASVLKVPFRSMLAAVLAALSLAGEIIYLFLNGSEGKMLDGVIFLALEAAVLAIVMNIRQQVCGLQWKKLF